MTNIIKSNISPEIRSDKMKSLTNAVNRRVQKIFFEETRKSHPLYAAHTNIESLWDEIQNGTPTKTEMKAWKDIRDEFRPVFEFIMMM